MIDNQLTRRVLVACGVALLFVGVAVAQGPVATATVGATQIDWAPSGSFGLQLTVSGPNGFYMQQTFDAGQAASFSLFDQGGQTLPAGSYTYELRAVPQLDKAQRDELAAAREAGTAPGTLRKAGKLPAARGPMSGAFAVRDGAIVMGGAEEAAPVSKPGGNQIAAKDQVILDDLIVDGSACIGQDCVNGESFGFDTLRLKENNLRIKFQDTSSSGSFPTNDWQLTANDSANGGANKFSIDDIDGGKTPFTVEAGARTNALYVDDGGRIGVGTSNPVVRMHAVDGNTPTLRLEQDGSSGFTPQTWDVAGNEANFFIRDVTNGSKLPVQIKPGAPTASIFVKADGNVGLGTSSPGAQLDVRGDGIFQGTDGATALTVQEGSTTSAQRIMMTVTNNGAPQTELANTSNGITWRFGQNDTGSFVINDTADLGVAELRVDTNGDVYVNGTVVHSSSRELKENFTPLDPRSVLEKVAALPVQTWNFKHDESTDKHVGPTAEDFYAAFGLGKTDKYIADGDTGGVALLAIKGLNEELEAKDAEIAQVQKQTTELLEQKDRQIEELNARIEAIEKALEQR